MDSHIHVVKFFLKALSHGFGSIKSRIQDRNLILGLRWGLECSSSYHFVVMKNATCKPLVLIPVISIELRNLIISYRLHGLLSLYRLLNSESFRITQIIHAIIHAFTIFSIFSASLSTTTASIGYFFTRTYKTAFLVVLRCDGIILLLIEFEKIKLYLICLGDSPSNNFWWLFIFLSFFHLILIFFFYFFHNTSCWLLLYFIFPEGWRRAIAFGADRFFLGKLFISFLYSLHAI